MTPSRRRVSDVSVERSASDAYSTFGDHQRRVGVFYVTDCEQLELRVLQDRRQIGAFQRHADESKESRPGRRKLTRARAFHQVLVQQVDSSVQFRRRVPTTHVTNSGRTVVFQANPDWPDRFPSVTSSACPNDRWMASRTGFLQVGCHSCQLTNSVKIPKVRRMARCIT